MAYFIERVVVLNECKKGFVQVAYFIERVVVLNECKKGFVKWPILQKEL